MLSIAMRRRLLRAVLYGSLAAAGIQMGAAQESAGRQGEEAKADEGKEPDLKWHLINTGIFFAIAGYGIAKLAPSFFNARSEDIQRAIKEATGLKMEADFRSSEIDRKMATLPDAVAKMREDARREMEREHQRRLAETAAEVRTIEANVLSDVEGMRAEGRGQIRRRATRAALSLAERRLREEAAGRTDSLVGDFIGLVERGKRA